MKGKIKRPLESLYFRQKNFLLTVDISSILCYKEPPSIEKCEESEEYPEKSV